MSCKTPDKKTACGSALLRSPELIHEIVTGLVEKLSTPVGPQRSEFLKIWKKP